MSVSAFVPVPNARNYKLTQPVVTFDSFLKQKCLLILFIVILQQLCQVKLLLSVSVVSGSKKMMDSMLLPVSMLLAAESSQCKNTPLQTHGGGDKPDVPPGRNQHDLGQSQPEPQPDEGAGGGQPEGGGGDGGQLHLIEPSRHWPRIRGCCTGITPTPNKLYPSMF